MFYFWLRCHRTVEPYKNRLRIAMKLSRLRAIDVITQCKIFYQFISLFFSLPNCRNNETIQMGFDYQFIANASFNGG